MKFENGSISDDNERTPITEHMRQETRRLKISLALGFCFVAFYLHAGATKRDPVRLITKSNIATALDKDIQHGLLPEELELDVEGVPTKLRTEYALDSELQARANKIFGQYKPDYGAFVAMDPDSGKILSLVSYTHGEKLQKNLALTASVPAASIFKIVSAAAAIDRKKLQPETVISFNGANHTLYRRNLFSVQNNRWTRHMTVKEAFAKSVNVVFAKIGVFFLSSTELAEYAERFLFNKKIEADVPVESGYFTIPDDNTWGMAEAASGFNQEVIMSPLQGAVIAAAVMNQGIVMEPFMVEKLHNAAGVTYEATPIQVGQAISPESAKMMRELMFETIRTGTSRKAFRNLLHRKKFSELVVGGKTGSIDSVDPKGRTDWFVGFGEMGGKRIAVAALTINVEKWKIKSSEFARQIFEAYFNPPKQKLPGTELALPDRI